jgi:hypothetical protein
MGIINVNFVVIDHLLFRYFVFIGHSSSFLVSTALLRPWPPPQNPAEFLGGFSTFSFLQGRDFLGQLNSYKLLMKKYAPCN